MSRFSAWLEEYNLSPEQLALVRIAISGSYLLFAGMYHFEWMAEFPPVFFHPYPSLATLFHQFPSLYVLHILNFSIPFFAVMLLAGYKTELAAYGFVISYIICFSFAWAFGQINSTFLVPVFTLLMAPSGWGRKYSIDAYLNKGSEPDTRNKSFWVNYLAMFIAFAYFTSGFVKIAGGWLSLSSQATYGYLVDNYYVTQRTAILAPYLISLHSKLFWEAGDYFTAIIEVSALLLLLYPRHFRLSLFCIATFHVFVFLSLNISFGYYPLLLTAFIVDWKHSGIIKRLINFCDRHLVSFFRPANWYLFVLVYAIYMLVFYLRGYKSWLNGYAIEINVALFVTYFVLVIFYIEYIKINGWLFKGKKQPATRV
jgi:hypothetical protein